MKTGTFLCGLAAAIKAFSDVTDKTKSAEEEHQYYLEQRKIFYQVVLEKEIASRFMITTTLVTLSSACLAVIPNILNITAHADGVVSFPTWMRVVIWIAFITLGLNILFGLWMYVLDSRQLGYLKAKNDDVPAGPDYAVLTALLQKMQYQLFAVSVISVVIMAVWRVLYI